MPTKPTYTCYSDIRARSVGSAPARSKYPRCRKRESVAHDLTRRSAHAGSLAHTADPGIGADITTVNFGPKSLAFDQLPQTFPAGKELDRPGEPRDVTTRSASEQPPLTHITRQHPKPYRLRTGQVVQRRTGWAAYPDKIVSVTAERPLARTDTGSYRPTGDWTLVRRECDHLPGKATRTTGSVPDDSANPTPGTPAPNGGGTVPERFRDGADALMYLPTAVRRSVITHVPDPTGFDGKVIQYADDKSIEVTVVRRSARHAVVAIGILKPGSRAWDVTMLNYAFPGPATVEGP